MKFAQIFAAALLAFSAGPAFCGEPALEGVKDIVLHTRDGQAIVIGTATFAPKGEATGFKLNFDDKKFAEYFLSMREFKCVEGADILCHVPYPYAHPDTVTPQDLSWLEHALLFIYKRPTDYGAQMGNGLIYTMKITPDGIVGTPQAIDLDEIAMPPANLSAAYYGAGPSLRHRTRRALDTEPDHRTASLNKASLSCASSKTPPPPCPTSTPKKSASS